jgi:hypothetical protein
VDAKWRGGTERKGADSPRRAAFVEQMPRSTAAAALLHPPLLFLPLLALIGCGPGVEWVRPEADFAANRQDYQACQDDAARQIRAEFAGLGFDPGSIPSGFPMQAIPDVQPRYGFDAYGNDDVQRRLERDTAQSRLTMRQQQLLRECLIAKGFRQQPRGDSGENG